MALKHTYRTQTSKPLIKNLISSHFRQNKVPTFTIQRLNAKYFQEFRISIKIAHLCKTMDSQLYVRLIIIKSLKIIILFLLLKVTFVNRILVKMVVHVIQQGRQLIPVIVHQDFWLKITAKVIVRVRF